MKYPFGVRMGERCVASLAEAWIEIIWQTFFSSGGHVASLAEAWIEIVKSFVKSFAQWSPPSRRRGLKYE